MNCFALAPYVVTADANELRQLITNIADNSLKYKSKARAALRVTLAGEGEKCRLEFADNGPGAPADKLDKLFDIFYRGDPSRGSGRRSSGLGLAIVQKTAARMGGTVRAINGAQGGLAIVIFIPSGGGANAEDIDH